MKPVDLIENIPPRSGEGESYFVQLLASAASSCYHRHGVVLVAGWGGGLSTQRLMASLVPSRVLLPSTPTLHSLPHLTVPSSTGPFRPSNFLMHQCFIPSRLPPCPFTSLVSSVQYHKILQHKHLAVGNYVVKMQVRELYQCQREVFMETGCLQLSTKHVYLVLGQGPQALRVLRDVHISPPKSASSAVFLLQ